MSHGLASRFCIPQIRGFEVRYAIIGVHEPFASVVGLPVARAQGKRSLQDMPLPPLPLIVLWGCWSTVFISGFGGRVRRK